MTLHTEQNNRAMADILDIMGLPDASNEQLRAALGALSGLMTQTLNELVETKDLLDRAIALLAACAPQVLGEEGAAAFISALTGQLDGA